MEYTLIRSRRRSLSIQISPTGELIARAPLRITVRQIEDFIMRKKTWIEKHQSRMQNTEGGIRRKIYSSEEVQRMKSLLMAYIIPRVGELWEANNLPQYMSIKITKSEGRWGSCSAKNRLCFSYRLAEYLDEYTLVLSSRAKPRDLPQSDEKKDTEADSSLRQNDKKKDFIDAIIVHELAHLREKNHQKPFWNLVYRMMPEYEKIMKQVQGGSIG